MAQLSPLQHGPAVTCPECCCWMVMVLSNPCSLSRPAVAPCARWSRAPMFLCNASSFKMLRGCSCPCPGGRHLAPFQPHGAGAVLGALLRDHGPWLLVIPSCRVGYPACPVMARSHLSVAGGLASLRDSTFLPLALLP